MKKYVFLFLLPLMGFMACDDDDGYSLDDFWVSMATVDNPDNQPYFYLELDNNELVWIAATNYPYYTPRTGQRILVDYTILNDKPENSGYDHDVKLNDAYNVLTKDIFYITPSSQDSIGNDPIDIRDIWVGSDYLNIQFIYGANNKRHMLNLVYDESKVYSDGKTHLEFRHNANDDADTYRAGGLVSFDLSSLRPQPREGDLELVIHVKERDGQDRTYNVVYKYNNDNRADKSFDRNYFANSKDLDIE